MTKLPDLSFNIDPDVIKATEAWSGVGTRQLRVVRIKDENLYYLDARDFDWVMTQVNEGFWRWRILNLWTQIAMAATLENLSPSDFARLIYE